MKTMKKIRALVLTLTLTAMILPSCGGGTSEPEWPAMEALSSLSLAGITSIEYVRMTEGGVGADMITDAAGIEDVYLRLKEVSIKEETDKAVDDDGLSITVHTADKDISFTFEGNILVLESGSRYEVENLDSVKNYIDQLEAKLDSEGSGGTGSSTSGAGDYDISKGFAKETNSDGSIEYLYFNDFMMTMPGNEKWSFEMKGNTVTFYLFSAQQEGYGGKLVSIIAYDLNDDSYKQLPSYHEAGITTNSNVRLIAEYPTDVQWNHSDASQEADYKDLQAYLQKIGAGAGAVNSPLQTGDSD